MEKCMKRKNLNRQKGTPSTQRSLSGPRRNASGGPLTRDERKRPFLLEVLFTALKLLLFALIVMGFGGLGESGMGSYHGKVGFDAFAHPKSILDKKTWLDLPMRYQPYKRGLYGKLLRFFLK